MFYVQRGSVPHTRHTQHRAPDGSALRRGAVRRRGLRRPQLAPLPPRRRRRGRTGSRPAPRSTLARGGRRGRTATAWSRPAPSPPPATSSAAASRCSSTRTSRWAWSARPGRCRPGRSTATARPTRCSSSTRASGIVATGLRRPAPTGRATTSSFRSGRRGGSNPTPGRAADALAGDAGRARAAEALPQRLRPAARARARTTSATSACPSRAAPHAETGDFTIAVKARGQLTAYHYGRPSVRRGRLGRLPLAVHLQHRRLPADHRTRPPAAAGPPDVPGPQLRRLLVRAPQVRLPPTVDPGAVQPLEHQLGRGHLLRRRQLHEPARRRHRLVHASIRPASRTGRTRARSRPPSARRATEELAVMVDTFHPLRLTAPGGRARGRPLPLLVAAGRTTRRPRRRRLAERGPEAFPD